MSTEIHPSIVRYNCIKIKTEKDFAVTEDSLRNKKQYCENYNISVLQTWKKLINYLKPGEASDGTNALRIDITCNIKFDKDEDIDEFAVLFLCAIEKEFAASNILSCVSWYDNSKENEMPIAGCSTVVFPLNRRVPDPDKWLDKIKKNQPNTILKEEIEERLNSKFPSIFITGKQQNIDKRSLGYEDALINYKKSAYKKEYDHALIYRVKDPYAVMQTTIPYDRMLKISNEVLTYFTIGPERLLYERSQNPSCGVTQQEVMEKVKKHITTYYKDVAGEDFNIIMSKVRDGIYGNHILNPLLDADDVSDIFVNDPSNIRVKANGERYTANLKFINGEDYIRFIEGLSIRHGIDLRNNATNVFSDIDSNPYFRLRFNITTNYINSSIYPYLQIRKIAKTKRDYGYLLNAGMFDEQIAEYLIDRARIGSGMVFTGKGASGKTTLMNFLLDCIPFNKSGLVIQESDELFSTVHPGLAFEHVTHDESRGKIYGLQELSVNGLLTDLDYFIIGEVKGAEAKYFITAAESGTRCWCSVHSSSSTEALDKLAYNITLDSSFVNSEAIHALRNLGTVVYMENFKVCEISEISGWDENAKKILYTPVYKRPKITF